jgi:DNA helicase-2/ATP-dependent DNA helicase PcrA
MHGTETYATPSRFLREIPAELLEEIRPSLTVARPIFRRPEAERRETAGGVRLGARVRHRKFGEGVILNSEGSGAHARVQVNFEHVGTKWLVVAYANLELM